MIGDIEDHLVGAVELGLVESFVALRALGEAFGAEILDLFGGSIDILDQDAEMMDAAEIESRSLVPSEVRTARLNVPSLRNTP
jgi:hypothetical protein